MYKKFVTALALLAGFVIKGIAQPNDRTEKVNKAIAELSRMIAEHPDSRGYWQRANYYQETDQAKAIDDYDKAISLYVDGQALSLTSILIPFSESYIITGQIDKAMGCITRAVDFENTSGSPVYKVDNLRFLNFSKGKLYSYLGQFDQSFKLMEAGAQESDWFDDIYNLAREAMLVKDYTKAGELFKKAKQIYDKRHPEEQGNSANTGELNFENFIKADNAIIAGNYNSAIELLNGNFTKSFTTLDPLKLRTLSSYIIMADIYERLNMQAVALDYYKKVMAISPSHAYSSQKIAALEKYLADKSKGDTSPPVITLFSPAAINRGQKIQADKNKTMLIKGRAEDASGINWVKINGKTLDGSKVSNGFFEIQTEPAALIEIQASDNAGNTSKIYSYEVALSEPSPRPSALDGENYYALFIACSNYEGKWPPLNSTLNEARNLGKVLTSKYHFKADTVFNSSRIVITDAIAKFINEHNKPTDNLVIFFAGHGTMQKTDNEPVGYLVPLFAQKTGDYIARKDVAVLLNRSMAKHILFITDACLSEFMRGDTDIEAMRAQNSTDNNLPSRQLLTSSETKNASGKSVLVPTLIDELTRNTVSYLSVTDLFSKVFTVMFHIKETNPELPLPTIGPMRLEGDQLGVFYFKKD